ncbi:hypothetical protein [Mycobacteroides abscessus]|uniref:hypothetical protein n=1 Tax=Mycobacteroides abscessus TaxID=36809 RepID=UPI00092ABED7|nr:hypothetical protein [Mycobacteroides abscessus]SIE12805.1 Uncharacterised protein [Mycobacteroides abscessus subsp. abscessus]SKU94107.1 Uncharacterised protein [Mycobacteroides abscessus subsp. bolletii]
MPQLTYCDPIAQLAAAHHLEYLLTQYRDITRRFGQPVYEALWLRGEAQRVLIDNVDRIAEAGNKILNRYGPRIDAIRQISEHSIHAAAQGAQHASSIIIPEFL